MRAHCPEFTAAAAAAAEACWICKYMQRRMTRELRYHAREPERDFYNGRIAQYSFSVRSVRGVYLRKRRGFFLANRIYGRIIAL